MTALELIQLMVGSGVLSGGLGIATWALRMEKRVIRLEVRAGIQG